ncbi:MAG: DUF2188 domain-containing protein [Streptosporangiales bacterium]|nr:DUF2188 domain-containing protein [Streptosporangiales bacterium]
MSAGDVETYYEGGRWKNRRQGRTRAFGTGENKAAVQAQGRAAAMRDGVEHIIKRRDGTISARHTYPRRRDPRATKG